MDKKKALWLWESYFNKKDKGWLHVKSGSMYPMISVNDNVLVKKCTFESISLFSLVVFKLKGKLIVHRVLKKKKDHLLQGGDNYSSPYIIHKDCIIGRVTCIRGSDYIIDMESKKNLCLNIIVSFLYLLIHKIPARRFRLSKINYYLITQQMRNATVKSRGEIS